MAACVATTSRDDLLNLSLFVWVFKSGIWLSIPEPVQDRGAWGCGCGKLRCVTTSPNIDLRYQILEISLPVFRENCSFTFWVTCAGEEVGSRERAPA